MGTPAPTNYLNVLGKLSLCFFRIRPLCDLFYGEIPSFHRGVNEIFAFSEMLTQR